MVMATVSSLCLDRQCWRPLPGLIQRPQSWWWPSVLHWALGPCCVCPGATLCSRGHCGRADAGCWGPGLALHPHVRAQGPNRARQPPFLLRETPRHPSWAVPRPQVQPWSSGLWLGDRARGGQRLRAHTGAFPGKGAWAPRRHLPGHSSACAPSTLAWPGTCLLLRDARAGSLFSQLGLEPLGALRPVDSQRQSGPRACGVTAALLLRTRGRPPRKRWALAGSPGLTAPAWGPRWAGRGGMGAGPLPTARGDRRERGGPGPRLSGVRAGKELHGEAPGGSPEKAALKGTQKPPVALLGPPDPGGRGGR